MPDGLKRGLRGKQLHAYQQPGGHIQGIGENAPCEKQSLRIPQKLILRLSSISRPPGFDVLVPNAGLLIVATGLPKLR